MFSKSFEISDKSQRKPVMIKAKENWCYSKPKRLKICFTAGKTIIYDLNLNQISNKVVGQSALGNHLADFLGRGGKE